MKSLKSKKGITLIALVITIIVLLILAGVTISAIVGENGIINKTQDAKEETKIGEEKDKISLALAEYELERAENPTLTITEFFEGKDGFESVVQNETTKEITIKLSNGKEYKLDENGTFVEESEDSGIVEPTNIDDWEWTLDEETNIVTITGYKGDDTEVIVPNYIDGHPVKKISGYILWDYSRMECIEEVAGMYNYYYTYSQDTITKLIISEGIETIDNYIFKWSVDFETYLTGALKEIVLPESLVNISNYAFDGFPGADVETSGIFYVKEGSYADTWLQANKTDTQTIEYITE